MTLEDPVEYPVAMMRQTSVNEAAKMDFVNGIRSMMRQDPDIILVGEVRDKDTAEMAFRAAMTGHQVFTTLHTNSALGAFPRLLDIGILPDIMAGNVIGIIAQRLVRMLCTHCKEAYTPSREERQLLGLDADAEHQDLPAGRLQALQLPRLSRAHHDHGDPAHGRRPRRAGGAPRHPEEMRNLALEKGFRRWSKRASRASWTAAPASPRWRARWI